MPPEGGTPTAPGFDVTEADHEAGFKDCIVTTKSGKALTVRVTALSHREAPSLLKECSEKGDMWLVLYRSLSTGGNGENGEKLLNRLSPFDAAQLLGVAWALGYGTEFQKKIATAGEAMWEGLALARSQMGGGGPS